AAPGAVPAGGALAGGILAGIPDGAGVPPVGTQNGGAPEPVLLGDVAEVREVGAGIAGISRTNGEPSLSLNITKEPDANTVEVADGVEAALEEVRDDLGKDEVLVVFNSAEDVEESVSGLVEKALIGGALAILIIFLFLRSLRATLVTAVSLPTSILAALLFSWADNLTLNIITLAGLTIAVGRVVDDAIVVLENSYRYVQKGYEPQEAALKGSTEVVSAITSSTLTTTAVFVPLGLVGGIVSKFFLPLSLTVAFALFASLLVAVTIIPALASAFIKRRAVQGRWARRAQGPDGEGLLVALYTPALRWSLRHRLLAVVLALGAFIGGLGAIPFLAVSFFPPSEERLLQATVELPAGTPLERTAEELRRFERILLDDPGVEGYQLSIGGEDNFSPDTPLRAENQAQAFIAVREDADVPKTLARVDEEGRDLYGDDFQVQVLSQGPPTGGLEVLITGGSQRELREASKTVTEELSKKDGITNVESDLSDVSPEVKVASNAEKAAEAGLSPTQVSASLGALLGGGAQLAIGETPVSVGAPEGSVDSLEEVRGLPVGSGVTVGEVAEVSEVEAPSAISRVDGDRAVTVTGTITSEDTSAVSNEVSSTLPKLDLPEGVTATVGGESEDIEESFRNLILSIVVALALVYLILVFFFGSLVVPLIILLAVPLTTVGAFGALLLTGTALSVPALLGVLLLIGIVVSNAILLVD
ncbi:MAG: efflux RND transporter permease subunit, partial [Actinomycetota bacterium]|nr:efflux RND transporter permease subunit [Actinomycetota bacterium]